MCPVREERKWKRGVGPDLRGVITQTGRGQHKGTSGVSVKPAIQPVLRPSREPCPVIEDRKFQLWVVPFLSEVITQTGPGHHEGNSGVSVKPPPPVSPAAQPRACQEFLVTFVSQTKVTRPSACEASGAKQLLTLQTLAVSQCKSASKPAKPHQSLADFAQQNRAFN